MEGEWKETVIFGGADVGTGGEACFPSPETVGYSRLPRSSKAMPEWPQAAPHKSAISIRPGVRERAPRSVCLPSLVALGPSEHFQSPAVLMPQSLRAGSWEHRGPRGFRAACSPWGTQVCCLRLSSSQSCP